MLKGYFLVSISLLWQNLHLTLVDGQCTTESACVGQSISQTSAIYCSAFESCRSAISIATDNTFFGYGSYSAAEAIVIDAGQYMYCWGESSCRDSYQLKTYRYTI